ncbi:MAG: hypothetical protein HYY06_18465 [Deltaproteobacteria bacterium]|nr:hypothetical protein [Deltaproteobacteria bacterium]
MLTTNEIQAARVHAAGSGATTQSILATAPDRDFWERDLLRHTYRARLAIEDDADALLEEIRKSFRSRPAVELIASLAGVDTGGNVGDIQEGLARHPLVVIHFLLVDDFAQYKTSAAVADIAEAYLPNSELAACRRRNDEYDRQLLLMHLYLRKPEALRYVQGLNDWHRKGAAPMVLKEKVRDGATKLEDFLVRKNIDPALADLRKKHPAHPRLHYVMTVPRKDDGQLVFLRRNLHPDYVWNDDGTDVHHGQKSEWIILHFKDGGRALKVCSVTSEVPRLVADRIATAFFGSDVHYVDDLQAASDAAIENFLAAITDPGDGRLPILEIVAANSPLRGGHKVTITNESDRNIIDGIDHFEEAVGDLFDDLDNLARIKVAFVSGKRKNRISLFFPKKNGTRVVQYDDGRLDKNRCAEFERFMQDEFSIKVRSTESKGGKR